MSWLWELLPDNCTGCGICRDVCPENAIRMTRDMGLPEPVPDACTGCGRCLSECPFDAISITPSHTHGCRGSRTESVC